VVDGSCEGRVKSQDRRTSRGRQGKDEMKLRGKVNPVPRD